MPIDAYAQVEDFAQWGDKTSPTDGEKPQIEMVLEAAARDIDAHCSRRFTAADPDAEPTPRLFVASLDGRTVDVDDLILGVSCSVDGRPVDAVPVPSDFGRPTTSLRGVFGRGAPVEVTAHWGWPAVPQQVVLANLMVALKLWERRNSPYGTEGIADIGFIRVTGVDRDVDSLLAGFVRWDRKIA